MDSKDSDSLQKAFSDVTNLGLLSYLGGGLV